MMQLIFSLVIAALFLIAFLIERWATRHERKRQRSGKPWWQEPPPDDEGDY